MTDLAFFFRVEQGGLPGYFFCLGCSDGVGAASR